VWKYANTFLYCVILCRYRSCNWQIPCTMCHAKCLKRIQCFRINSELE
jgi:hypothetical protein